MARSRDVIETEPEKTAPLDAYTGLLIVSLVATLTGLVFLYLDYKDYPDKPPAVHQVTLPKTEAAPQTAPSAAPGQK